MFNKKTEGEEAVMQHSHLGCAAFNEALHLTLAAMTSAVETKRAAAEKGGRWESIQEGTLDLMTVARWQ